MNNFPKLFTAVKYYLAGRNYHRHNLKGRHMFDRLKNSISLEKGVRNETYNEYLLMRFNDGSVLSVFRLHKMKIHKNHQRRWTDYHVYRASSWVERALMLERWSFVLHYVK